MERKEAVQGVITTLRKKEVSLPDIQRANNVIVANGLRVAEIQMALYFATNGDIDQARLQAGRAADALSKLI